MKIALTIAGFDPTGGAGLQQDLKVFHALDVYGISVVAALTAQNTTGVVRAAPVEAGMLKRQLDTLLSDITPDAVKIGMLYSVRNVRTVSRVIDRYRLRNVVLDPVILPSRGRPLAEGGVPEEIRKTLLPRCSVVTPNLHEASILSGMRIRDAGDMERAAAEIRTCGVGAVIITGGHLSGSPSDLFYDGTTSLLPGRRHAGEYHGTGCSFAAALAAFLAKGYATSEAARGAKRFMQRCFRRAIHIGVGMRIFDI